MSKYRYKQYIHRAFWNSLLAVLCALVVVLIIVYGWQGFKSVINKVLPEENQSEESVENQGELEFLDSLRGETTLSEEEQTATLESLRAEETSTGTVEEEVLLDSLRAGE
jgi:hypothetical protein